MHHAVPTSMRRAGPEFGQRVAQMRSFLEEFTPMTLDDASRD